MRRSTVVTYRNHAAGCACSESDLSELTSVHSRVQRLHPSTEHLWCLCDVRYIPKYIIFDSACHPWTKDETHSMGMPASRIFFAVPPDPSSRTPAPCSPLASSSRFVLSYTDSNASKRSVPIAHPESSPAYRLAQTWRSVFKMRESVYPQTRTRTKNLKFATVDRDLRSCLDGPLSKFKGVWSSYNRQSCCEEFNLRQTLIL